MSDWFTTSNAGEWQWSLALLRSSFGACPSKWHGGVCVGRQ